MLTRIRPRLTYANVVSTLCLFLLLGGVTYAATKISGKTIKKRTIAGKKLKKDTVRGKEVDEASLEGLMGSQIDYVFNEGPDNPGTGGGIPDVIDVSCPAGERAIGGGGAWIIANFADNDQPTALNSAWISASMPIPARPGVGPATGWRVAGRNITNTNRHLRAYAVCVPQE